MANITIRVDDKEVKAMMADLRRRVPKHLSQGITKTAKKDVTRNLRLLSKITSIPAQDIRKARPGQKLAIGTRRRGGRVGSISATTAKPPYHRSEIVVQGRGHLITARRYGARQVKAGVKARVWGRMRLLRGSFMGPRPGVIAPKLHGGVWRRKGEARMPLEPRQGANIARVREHIWYRRAEEAYLRGELKVQIDRQMNRVVRQRYR